MWWCLTNLPQVVKVVFASNPAVACIQTLGSVGDFAEVTALAVEELPLKQLHRATDRCATTNIQTEGKVDLNNERAQNIVHERPTGAVRYSVTNHLLSSAL